MDKLLQGLRAIAEGTRLRLLGLCAHAELSVTDLMEILGQSQPRVSRHLKLLVEAGLLTRHQEGPWAYYRLADNDENGALARMIVDLLPENDPVHALDLKRLQGLTEEWTKRASDFFSRNAEQWEKIRALHVNQATLDQALLELMAEQKVESLLDLGTGTGHILQLAGETVQRAVGIDQSREMLNVARANLFRAGLKHCQVRQADISQLPFSDQQFDVVTLQMVLHYVDRPGAALREAARVVSPNGRLIVVDFAPHNRSDLRSEFAHRWLGFSSDEIGAWCSHAGMTASEWRRLEGSDLTVVIWSAQSQAAQGRAIPQHKQSSYLQ